MSNKSRTELVNFLFHLRTPLSGISAVSEITFGHNQLCNNMPQEVIAWLEKWTPKVNFWKAEVLELSGMSKTDDRDWKKVIQNLLITLDGVEAAAIDANAITFSNEQEDKDFIEIIVSSSHYIDKQYKIMRDLLPALD
jgi:hypothetical protein